MKESCVKWFLLENGYISKTGTMVISMGILTWKGGGVSFSNEEN